MRIIAGFARGRTIIAPKGQDTRPTQDHVRESLFNILQRDIPDANVLDLFAGSGALGLEAVSRGASEATLVDCSTDAIQCIRQNVETLHAEAQVHVVKCDWKTALTKLAADHRQYSLVFLDPPYRMTDTPTQCAMMGDINLLQPGAVMVIEHHKDHEPNLDTRFMMRSARQYGDTMIHFYVYQEEAITNE